MDGALIPRVDMPICLKSILLWLIPALSSIAAHAQPVDPAIQCGSSDARIARKQAELPGGLVRELPGRMADPGEPFLRTDVIGPEQERLPWMRLICGYPTSDGYVVRWERGGRGYGVGDTRFRKTPTGFVPD